MLYMTEVHEQDEQTLKGKHIKELEEALMDLRSIEAPAESPAADDYIDSAIRIITGVLNDLKNEQ